MNVYTYVGIVEHQRLHLLLAEDRSSGACQLTAASEAASFDRERLELFADDGRVLLVRGIRSGDWIHSAIIVERGSELVSLIAQVAFGRTPKYPQG